MAITSLSLVNQKLAYTRAVLKLVRSSPPPTHASERLGRQALLDGAVFHLVCAYHHYLHEFAENYRVKNVGQVSDEQDLINALAAIDKGSAEALEMKLLREQSSSWLSQLHTYYHFLWSYPEAESEDYKNNPDNLAFDITDTPLAINPDLVASWESAFSVMVARHRESSVEY